MTSEKWDMESWLRLRVAGITQAEVEEEVSRQLAQNEGRSQDEMEAEHDAVCGPIA